MDGLFPFQGLWSFGPNYLDPPGDTSVLVRICAARRSGLRAQVRKQCSRRPGVYGMVSRKGKLIYVGKAKCLRARLLSYFRSKSRDAKAGRILDRTKFIVWENAPSEFAALLRELELIRRWRPRLNVQGQPGRRRPIYLCLGRQPAPYAFLSRDPPAGALAAFGPIPAGRRAREAVRFLNDSFRLRDCPRAQEMFFADQAELFPVVRTAGCLRYEIGTCLGPCLGACSRAEYMERVRAARGFLAGTNLAVLETLESAMSEASAALAFERAAVLRDKLERLRWLHERLDRLHLASTRPAFVYPVEGYGGKDLWYLIQGGKVVASVPAPRTRAERQAVAKMFAKAFRQKNVPTRIVPVSELDSVFLVAAWFRRHPQEQARILRPDQALPQHQRLEAAS
jgi:excinuclease ABC subunit C